MNSEIYFEGKKYICVKKASELTGYSRDYVGQLCRENKIDSRRIERSWYVSENSILNYSGVSLKQTLEAENLNNSAISRSAEISGSLKNKAFSGTGKGPNLLHNFVRLAGASTFLGLVIMGVLSVRASDLEKVSKSISSTPKNLYAAVESVSDFYAQKLGRTYLSTGEAIFVTLPKRLNESKIFSSESLFSNVERGLTQFKISKFVFEYNFHNFVSEALKVQDTKDLYLKNKISLAALALEPFQRSSLLVYESVNSFFDKSIYSRLNTFFGRKEKDVSTALVINKKEALVLAQTTREEVPSKAAGQKNAAALVTQKVTDITQIIEKVTPGDVTRSYVDLSIQQLSNKLTSEFSKLSVGGGGTVSSIYQQIAGSQKIDNLYNTAISNPIITGGRISGVTLGATDFTADLGSITTLSTTNLTVSGGGNNVLLSTNAGGLVVGTSTPSFGNFNAMSLTATSTISTGGITIGNNQFVVQQNSGRIGVGTTSPDALIEIFQTNNGWPILSAYRNTDIAPAGDFINFKTKSGTTLFRVDNSGNLLAGGIVNSGSQTITSISSPQLRVQYDGSNEITFGSTSNGSTTLSASGTNSSINFATQNNLVNAFNFQNSAGVSVLNIDNLNTRIGVGTAAPNFTMEVNGSASTTNLFTSYAEITNSTTTNATTTSLYSNNATFSKMTLVSTPLQAPSGSDSLFFGNSAGNGTVGATNSNFLGAYAGSGATNAYNSNFLGNLAGNAAYFASDSNFFGANAGDGASISYNSNFFGKSAGKNASSASESNFFGLQSGMDATYASDSNFFGFRSGYGATDASESNFFGLGSGSGATGAYNSNFFGSYAGRNATNASLSNFFGYYTGNGATNASNSNFLGYLTGNGATNASYSNIFGYKSGSAFNGNNIGSNNIIIGTNISLPDGVANAINIGGVLFGTGARSSTAGNPSITPEVNGKISIGTTTPNNKLDIYSESKSAIGFSGASGDTYKWTMGMDVANGGRFSIASSTALGTNERFVIDGLGNIGVGTTSPYEKLSVIGAVVADRFNATSTTATTTISTGGLSVGSSQFVVQQNSGNVGIGTSTPYGKFSLQGSGGSVLIDAATTGSGILTITGGNSSADFNFIGSGASYDFRNGNGLFNIKSNGASFTPFAVSGTQNTPKLKIIPHSAQSTDIFQVRNSGDTVNLASIGLTGGGYFADNLGVGSSTPGYKLSVAGSGYFDGGTVTAANFLATSSLTISGISINSLLSTNSSGVITATSTPTFGNFNATSTNATSTIAGGFTVAGGFKVDSTGSVLIGNGQNDGGTGAKLSVLTGIYTPGYVWATNGFKLSGNASIISGDTSTAVQVTGSGGLQLISGGPYLRNVGSSGVQVFQSDGSTSGSLTAATIYGGSSASSVLTFAGTSNGGPSNAHIILNGTGQGNVGIGTTNPQAKLDVTGGIRVNSVGTTTSGFADGVNMGTWDALGYDSTGVRVALGGYRSSQFSQVGLYTSGTEKVRIDTNGNVGIGTTSPATLVRLHVAKNNAFTSTSGLFGGSASILGQGAEAGIAFSVDIGAAGTQTGAETGYGGMGFIYQSATDYNNLRLGTQSNTHLIFRTNNTDRMTILNSGNVGIGITNPAQALHVKGGVNTYIRVQNSNNTGGDVGIEHYDGTNAVYSGLLNGSNCGAGNWAVYNGGCRLVVRSNGNVGIGGTAAYFHTDGNSALYFGSNGSDKVWLDSGSSFAPVADNTYNNGRSDLRWAVVYSAGGVVTTSDAREKHDIVDTDLGLDFIMKLRPVSYELNTIPGQREGLIAQEVIVALNGHPFGGAIDYSSTTDRYGLNYAAFVSPLIKAVQEIAHISGTFKDALIAWFADTANGITEIIAGTFRAKDKLCINNTCVTEAQLQALILNAGNGGQATSTPATDTSIPVITIIGNNPAQVTRGSSYVDLGATVSDTDANGNQNNNLILHFNVDGTDVAEINIDTSATSTHTIIYSTFDGAGNYGYATRTVEVIE